MFQVSPFQRVMNIDVCYYFPGLCFRNREKHPNSEMAKFAAFALECIKRTRPRYVFYSIGFTMLFINVKKHKTHFDKLTFEKTKCCVWFALPQLLSVRSITKFNIGRGVHLITLHPVITSKSVIALCLREHVPRR